MNDKTTISDREVIDKIKALVGRNEYAIIKQERKRINDDALPKYNALLAGLKLRYIETGEIVIVTEIGGLFETIRARFPNGDLLWCLPEEFARIEREATHDEQPHSGDSGAVRKGNTWAVEGDRPR